jgi:hypothetical protein
MDPMTGTSQWAIIILADARPSQTDGKDVRGARKEKRVMIEE